VRLVLRDAESGTEFTITVRGRAVARLGPAAQPRERRLDVDRDTFHAILADTPVDDAFATATGRTLHTLDEGQASLAVAVGVAVRSST
jgi:antitoxin (DNA-binding transcriptional repressor) of toxin-antitoxin stability system